MQVAAKVTCLLFTSRGSNGLLRRSNVFVQSAVGLLPTRRYLFLELDSGGVAYGSVVAKVLKVSVV